MKIQKCGATEAHIEGKQLTMAHARSLELLDEIARDQGASEELIIDAHLIFVLTNLSGGELTREGFVRLRKKIDDYERRMLKPH